MEKSLQGGCNPTPCPIDFGKRPRGSEHGAAARAAPALLKPARSSKRSGTNINDTHTHTHDFLL